MMSAIAHQPPEVLPYQYVITSVSSRQLGFQGPATRCFAFDSRLQNLANFQEIIFTRTLLSGIKYPQVRNPLPEAAPGHRLPLG